MPKPQQFKKPMTDKKYLKNRGKCPYCHSTNVEGEGVDIDHDATQVVTCHSCFASWFDIYELVGYSVINEPL